MTLGKWRREGLRGLWRKESLCEAAAGGVSGTLQLEREPRAGGWQRAVTARSAPSLRLPPCLPGPRKGPGLRPSSSLDGKGGPRGTSELAWVAPRVQENGARTLVLRPGASRTETPLALPRTDEAPGATTPPGTSTSHGFSLPPPPGTPHLAPGPPGRRRGGRRWPEAPTPQKPRAVLPAPRWGVGTTEGTPWPTLRVPQRSRGMRETERCSLTQSGGQGLRGKGQLGGGVLSRQQEPSPRGPPGPSSRPTPVFLAWGPPQGSGPRRQYSLRNLL